jgi:hypothetical protein
MLIEDFYEKDTLQRYVIFRNIPIPTSVAFSGAFSLAFSVLYPLYFNHLYTSIGHPRLSAAHSAVKMICPFSLHPHYTHSVAHFFPLSRTSLHHDRPPSTFSGTFRCKDDLPFFASPSLYAFCGTFFSAVPNIFTPQSATHIFQRHIPGHLQTSVA